VRIVETVTRVETVVAKARVVVGGGGCSVEVVVGGGGCSVEVVVGGGGCSVEVVVGGSCDGPNDWTE